jgi:hypothetical protein
VPERLERLVDRGVVCGYEVTVWGEQGECVETVAGRLDALRETATATDDNPAVSVT